MQHHILASEMRSQITKSQFIEALLILSVRRVEDKGEADIVYWQWLIDGVSIIDASRPYAVK